MILVNLATIYLGTIPTLQHTQHYAYILSRIHLRYVLTGELDWRLDHLIQDLSTTTCIPTGNYPPRTIPST
jgi:hypothetical protein